MTLHRQTRLELQVSSASFYCEDTVRPKPIAANTAPATGQNRYIPELSDASASRDCQANRLMKPDRRRKSVAFCESVDCRPVQTAPAQTMPERINSMEPDKMSAAGRKRQNRPLNAGWILSLHYRLLSCHPRTQLLKGVLNQVVIIMFMIIHS